MNTHIYLECVVNFRIPPGAEGRHFRNDSRIDVSGVRFCRWGPVDQVSTNAFAKNSGCHCHEISIGKLAIEKAVRTPKSPWLPFSLLINAISNEITAKQMNLVTSNLELFKSKKTCRDEFVRRLRLIVGDTLLKSTITSFSCKVPSKSIELLQPKQEPLNETMPIPLARATY